MSGFIPNQKGQGCTSGKTFCLHVALHVSYFNLNANATTFRKMF